MGKPKTQLDVLRNHLWDISKEDWSLGAEWTLTEPVMAAAWLGPESASPVFQDFGSTIEEAINRVLEAAYAKYGIVTP